MPQYNHRPKLRAKVRELLALVPKGTPVTEKFIFDEIVSLDPTANDLREVRSVIAWLDDNAHIKSSYNGDEERTEWELTELGRQRANH